MFIIHWVLNVKTDDTRLQNVVVSMVKFMSYVAFCAIIGLTCNEYIAGDFVRSANTSKYASVLHQFSLNTSRVELCNPLICDPGNNNFFALRTVLGRWPCTVFSTKLHGTRQMPWLHWSAQNSGASRVIYQGLPMDPFASIQSQSRCALEAGEFSRNEW